MSDKMHPASGQGEWRALPRARTALVGAHGSDAIVWANRVCVGALVLAAVWWAWSALKPLDAGEEVIAQEVTRVPQLADREGPLAQRETVIASLGMENLFAADRKSWPQRLVRGPGGVADSGIAASDVAQAGTSPNGEGAQSLAASGGAAMLTPRENLPDDVKKALSALELKAVHMDSSGHGVAMISFVHSPERAQSKAYRAGDEFKEETNPQANWQVLAVEVVNRRVVLGRSGSTAALPLYRGLGDGPLARAEVAKPALAADAELSVQTQSRDEVVLELRSKGLSEAEIATVIAELDRQLDESGESAVKALANVVTAAPEAAPAEGAQRTPPAGMEAILKMMAEQSSKVGAENPKRSKDQPKPRR